MKTKILSLICLSLFLFSCKKESKNVPSAAALNAAYYIEGKVDGVMYRAEYICPYSGCEMSTGNYSSFMQNIHMERTMASNNPIGWQIEISYVKLDQWQLPDQLNASSAFGNEQLDFSFYSGSHNSDNHYLTDGFLLGDDSFKMTVTSRAGDVIEGVFNGKLRNGSNSSLTKTVTDGKFRIKLVRI